MEFQALVKKLTPTLKRITYKLNGHFAFFNHDDLYQEALLHLWNAYSSGKLEDKTDSYMLQGCYFHLKNYIRKAYPKSRETSLEGLLKSGNSEEENHAFDIEDKANGDYRDKLNDKLLVETIQNNGLTCKEKLILQLIKDGFTMRQIGSRLGVSHVMIVKNMVIIRQKCKKYLEN